MAELVDPDEFVASIQGLSNVRVRRNSPILRRAVKRLLDEAVRYRGEDNEAEALKREEQASAYKAEGMSPREEALEHYHQNQLLLQDAAIKDTETHKILAPPTAVREPTEPAGPGPIQEFFDPRFSAEPAEPTGDFSYRPGAPGPNLWRGIRRGQRTLEEAGQMAGALTEMKLKDMGVSDFPVDIPGWGEQNISPATIGGYVPRLGIEFAAVPTWLKGAKYLAPGKWREAWELGRKGAPGIRNALRRMGVVGGGFGGYEAGTESLEQVTGEAPESRAAIAARTAGGVAGGAAFHGVLGEAAPAVGGAAIRGGRELAARTSRGVTRSWGKLKQLGESRQPPRTPDQKTWASQEPVTEQIPQFEKGPGVAPERAPAPKVVEAEAKPGSSPPRESELGAIRSVQEQPVVGRSTKPEPEIPEAVQWRDAEQAAAISRAMQPKPIPEPVPGAPTEGVVPGIEGVPPVVSAGPMRTMRQPVGEPIRALRGLPRGMTPPPVATPGTPFERVLEPTVEVPRGIRKWLPMKGRGRPFTEPVPTRQAIERARRYDPGPASFEPTPHPLFRPRSLSRQVTPAEAASKAGVTKGPAVATATKPTVSEPVKPTKPIPSREERGLAPTEDYPSEGEKLSFSQFFLARKPEYRGVWDAKRAKADPDYEAIAKEYKHDYRPPPQTKAQELRQALADSEHVVSTGKNRAGLPLEPEAVEQHARWAQGFRDQLAKLEATERATKVKLPPAVQPRGKGTSPSDVVTDVAELKKQPYAVGPRESFEKAAQRALEKDLPEIRAGTKAVPPSMLKEPKDVQVEWGTIPSSTGQPIASAWVSRGAGDAQVVWDPQYNQWMSREFFLSQRKPEIQTVLTRDQIQTFRKQTGQHPTPELVERYGLEGEKLAAATAKGPSVKGKKARIGVTGEKTKIEGQWELVPLKAPIASHTNDFRPNDLYLKALQERLRDRAASKEQIVEYSRPEKFDADQILGGKVGNTGAPVIGPDNMVESGNGRMLILRRLKGESWKEYYATLREDLASYGIKEKDLKAMLDQGLQPILVRRRTGQLSMKGRVELAEKWNVRQEMAASPTEAAIKDSKKLSPELLEKIRLSDRSMEKDNPLEDASEFLQAFGKDVVPSTERAGFVEETGAVGPEGAKRARNAIFAYVYGHAGPKRLTLLKQVAESTHSETKNISRALVKVAPQFAKLRAGTEAGERWSHVDLSDDLARAAGAFSDIRAGKVKLEEWLRMEDMHEPIPPAVRQLMRIFETYTKRPARLAEVLEKYAEVAEKQGHPGQMGLLGEGGKPEKGHMLKVAHNIVEKGPGLGSDIEVANADVGSEMLMDQVIVRAQAVIKGYRAAGDYKRATRLEQQLKGFQEGKPLNRLKILKAVIEDPKGGVLPEHWAEWIKMKMPTADDLIAQEKAILHELGIKRNPEVLKEEWNDIRRWKFFAQSPEFVTRRKEHSAFHGIYRYHQKALDKVTQIRRMYLTQSNRLKLVERARGIGAQPPKALADAWKAFYTKLQDPSVRPTVARNRDTVLDALRGRISRAEMGKRVGPDGLRVFDEFQKLSPKQKPRVLDTLMRVEKPEGFSVVWRRTPWSERSKLKQALWEASESPAFSDRAHTVAELRAMGLGDESVIAYYRTQQLLDQALRTIINPLRKSMGLEPLTGRRNYLPHKWFGNWEIRVRNPDGTLGASIQTRYGTTYDTEHQAVKAAYSILEFDPTTKFKIVPSFWQRAVQETLPDSVEARMLSKLLEPLAKRLEVDESVILEAARAGIKPRGFSAHMEKREGARGYEMDELPRVIEAYLGQMSRYIPMRDAREVSLEILKTVNQRAQPELFASVERYIYSLHGGTTMTESLVDSVLQSVPVLGKHLGLRPTRAATRQVRSAVAQMKLGLLNTSFMLVNGTQFFTHALPILGPEYAARGLSMYFKAVLNPRSNEGRMLSYLEKHGLVEPAFLRGEGANLTARTGHFLYALGTQAERFNRAATLMGAFARLVERGFVAPTKTKFVVSPQKMRQLQALENRFRAMGLKPGKKVGNDRLVQIASNLKAKEFDWITKSIDAEKINRDILRALMTTINEKVNFRYDIGSRPESFRGPFGELFGQFRMFSVGTAQLWGYLGEYAASQPTALGKVAASGPLAAHIGAVLTLSGIMGFPFFRLFDKMVQTMSMDNFSPMDYFLEKEVPQWAMRGVPALAKIDVSRRLGYGDIIPEDWEDLAGATYNTIADTTGHLYRLDLDMAAREMAPGASNVYAAFRMFRDEMVRERNTRARTRYIPTEAEVFARGIGFRPLWESRWSDELRLLRAQERRYKWTRAAAIDRAVEIAESHVGAQRTQLLRDHMIEMRDKGILISGDDVSEEMKKKRLPQPVRQLPMVPKPLRKEFIRRTKPLVQEQMQRYREKYGHATPIQRALELRR